MTYLADRSTRDLIQLVEEWKVAPANEQPALEAAITTLAVERRGYMIEAMRRNPHAAMKLALNDETKPFVDAMIPDQTTSTETVTGTAYISTGETNGGGFEVLYDFIEAGTTTWGEPAPVELRTL